MKRYLCWFAVILSLAYCITGYCVAQTQRRSAHKKQLGGYSNAHHVLSERKAVLQTDSDLLSAIWNADVTARQKLADDSLLYTSYAGETLSKTQWIESVKKIDLSMASYQTKDIHILLKGSIAIVTGSIGIRFREEYENGGSREGSGWQRYTHVYQKKGNQWFLVIGQMTPIAKYLWKF